MRADNLPAELTSFVGRRSELTHVKGLLGTSRLVTLTGIGGVGKTRLALRVARDVRRVFADGVYLVELAAVKDPALVPHTLVHALDIDERSVRHPREVLIDHLRRRHVLLVLDNCEHVLDATAQLTDTLLRAAPQLRVLATSRQALMVPGEHLVPVSTLAVPDPDVPLRGGMATEYPGLALFTDRATAVLPDFTVTASNRDAVIQLCHRLEGIPLAIELAAARLGVLPVAELATRLQDRFQVLTQGSRTAPERQQTLQAAIDYSYRLCSERERMLWARASVFPGGFTLDAVEAVCSDAEVPRETILDTVAGLIEKSIIFAEDHESGARFRMLETLRDYGQARLREAAEDATSRRHRDWYLRLVERASAEWFGPAQETWTARLRSEHTNLRTALEYSLTEAGEAPAALRMSGLPWFLWLACGSMAEGRMWLERALALGCDASRDRAWALGTAGYIALMQGDEGTATTYLDECMSLGRSLQDDDVVAYATNLLGIKAFLSGELHETVALLEDALQRYERLGLPGDYLTASLLQLAMTHLLLDEVDRASELLAHAYARCVEARESWLLSEALWGRAFVRLIRGELEAADADLRESLRIKWRFRDTLGLAFVVEVFAWTTISRGNAETGTGMLGGASSIWQGVGAQPIGFRELMSLRERYENLARTSIGDAAYDAMFALGAEKPLDDLLAEVLGDLPAKTSSKPLTHANGPLTKREREVADLIANGLTNKGIAEALVLSPRTAEAHVEHILTKLGFTSRAQIAAWVAEHRAAG